jgi:hypothetical protein
VATSASAGGMVGRGARLSYEQAAMTRRTRCYTNRLNT